MKDYLENLTTKISFEYSGLFLLVLESLTITVDKTASFQDLEFKILVTSYLILKIGFGLFPDIFTNKDRHISIASSICELFTIFIPQRSSKCLGDISVSCSEQKFPNFQNPFSNSSGSFIIDT